MQCLFHVIKREELKMFESIKETNLTALHERSCIILYGFTIAEEKQILNTARLVGIKDCITLKSPYLKNTTQAVLDNKMTEEDCKPLLEKAILFNAIPFPRMNLMIDAIKKYRMKKPLYAIVTEDALNWTIKEWLMQLINERDGLKVGNLSVHE